MSIKGLLSPKEIRKLACAGKWWQTFNPFKSWKSLIESATEGNPRLCKRALWSASHYRIEDSDMASLCVPYSFALLISVLTGSLVFLPSISGYISSVALLSTVALIGKGYFMSVSRENLIKIAGPRPALISYGLLTNWTELDSIMSIDPIEGDELLLAGGMTEDQIRALSNLAQAMGNKKYGTDKCADDMLILHTTREVSQAGLDLVAKATAILSQNNIMQPAALPMPMTSALDVLEHAGIQLGLPNPDNSTLDFSISDSKTLQAIESCG